MILEARQKSHLQRGDPVGKEGQDVTLMGSQLNQIVPCRLFRPHVKVLPSQICDDGLKQLIIVGVAGVPMMVRVLSPEHLSF